MSKPVITFVFKMLRNEEFFAKSRVQGKSFKADTGGVDSAWQLHKESIPKSVSARAKGTAKFNSKMHMYIRAWQWRWENTAATNLCKKRQWHTCARKTPEKRERQNGNRNCSETQVLNKNEKKLNFQALQQYVTFTKYCVYH